MALKDNIDVAGVPTTNGLGPRPGAAPDRDAEVVRRLREAGAVILGKLNMHEAAFGATTDNPHHGRTHNPWRVGYTPGGSSGGTGAAVAARLCAAGLGTDTMGSIRLPAAFCGVAGLKATYGLVSMRGIAPLSWRLDHVGPLCRSVADLGLVLEAIAGFDAEDLGSIPPPAPGAAAGPWPAPASGPLRVGLIENFDAIPARDDVRRSVRNAVEILRAYGASVHGVRLPDYDPSRGRRAGLLVIEAEAWVIHEAALAEAPGAFTPELRRMLEYGRDAPAGRLATAERLIQTAGFALRRALQDLDVALAFTAPQPAFPFGERAPDHLADATALANFAGCPALSVPGGLSEEGLPIGLQLMAAPLRERRLLEVARVLEAALPVAAAPEPRPPG